MRNFSGCGGAKVHDCLDFCSELSRMHTQSRHGINAQLLSAMLNTLEKSSCRTPPWGAANMDHLSLLLVLPWFRVFFFFYFPRGSMRLPHMQRATLIKLRKVVLGTWEGQDLKERKSNTLKGSCIAIVTLKKLRSVRCKHNPNLIAPFSFFIRKSFGANTVMQCWCNSNSHEFQTITGM